MCGSCGRIERSVLSDAPRTSAASFGIPSSSSLRRRSWARRPTRTTRHSLSAARLPDPTRRHHSRGEARLRPRSRLITVGCEVVHRSLQAFGVESRSSRRRPPRAPSCRSRRQSSLACHRRRLDRRLREQLRAFAQLFRKQRDCMQHRIAAARSCHSSKFTIGTCTRRSRIAATASRHRREIFSL